MIQNTQKVFSDWALPGPAGGANTALPETPYLDIRGCFVVGKGREWRAGKGQKEGMERRNHAPYYQFLDPPVL